MICSLVRKISPPQIIFNNNILHLSENAIKQLDIELILKTIDYTYTKMGSRLLRKRIYNPYTQEADISCDTLNIAHDNLRNIKDIDKLWKKISSMYASHRDIVALYSSLEATKKIVRSKDELKETVTQAMKNNLNKAIDYICKRINIDDEENIIKPAYSEIIDSINRDKSEKISLLNDIRIDIHPYLLLFRGKDKIYFSCDSKTKREILSKENKYKINATNCTKHWKITDSRCETNF
jgi:DNA mismatch repair ATPase MutS